MARVRGRLPGDGGAGGGGAEPRVRAGARARRLLALQARPVHPDSCVRRGARSALDAPEPRRAAAAHRGARALAVRLPRALCAGRDAGPELRVARGGGGGGERAGPRVRVPALRAAHVHALLPRHAHLHRQGLHCALTALCSVCLLFILACADCLFYDAVYGNMFSFTYYRYKNLTLLLLVFLSFCVYLLYEFTIYIYLQSRVHMLVSVSFC